MIGTKSRVFTPIPHLTLEDLVPANHFYRRLDQILDLSFVREVVHPTYSTRGRPSIDPVVFFKLQLVMFFEGIRSERRLMQLVADKLSLRWYLGYNLDEPLPDHSSLTRIRTRYGLEVFRRFFDTIVERCQQAGLVWGQECYFDATQVQANANVDSLLPRFAVNAQSSVQDHLTSLFPAPSPEISPPLSLPSGLTPTETSSLAQDNLARHDWFASGGQPQREVIRGTYRRTADFRVSTTDSDATPLQMKNGGIRLGYQTHYVVDGGKHRIILRALVTPGEVMENLPMLDLLWHSCFRWRIRPHFVTGDTTYGSMVNIHAIEEAGIRAYLPLRSAEPVSAVWSPSYFQYDTQQDQYRCPQGVVLTRCQDDRHRPRIRYQAPPATCNRCPVKSQCTTSRQGRRIYRSLYDTHLERVRAYQQTEAYRRAIRKRKVWLEPLFAEAKDWHGMRRFRLRGLWRVNCEALLIAAGQNLKRLLQAGDWGNCPIGSLSTNLHTLSSSQEPYA